MPMTGNEWATGTDPLAMLDCVGDWASDRKLRLFLTGCCRRIWPLLQDDRCRQAVEVAERYADGLADRLELADALQAALAARASGAPGAPANVTALYLEPTRRLGYDPDHPGMRDVREGASRAAGFWANAQSRAGAGVWSELLKGERLLQCAILRDLFGSPHHPVAFDPAWRTPAVESLARSSYETRVMPSGLLEARSLGVLAEALDAGGNATAEITAHLRSPGPHFRGCWALDLALGRE